MELPWAGGVVVRSFKGFGKADWGPCCMWLFVLFGWCLDEEIPGVGRWDGTRCQYLTSYG